jgi:hypothetical protein
MTRSVLFALVLWISYISLASTPGYSEMTGRVELFYDSGTNTVTAEYWTDLDYSSSYWYEVWVEGYLHEPDGRGFLTYTGAGFLANTPTVNVSAQATAVPGKHYWGHGNHRLIAYYQYYETYYDCDPYCEYYYDQQGYSVIAVGETYPPPYYGTVTWWAPAYTVLRTEREIDVGSSNGYTAVPLPTLVLSSNNQVLSSGGTAYIDTTPAMPQLQAYLNPAISSINVTWQATTSYSAGQYSESLQTSSQVLPGNSVFDITGALGGAQNFFGGTVTLYWTIGSGSQQQGTIYVRGLNPSSSTVKAELGTDPWFIQHIAKLESQYQQFQSDGTPLFGSPNGFGIMQLDPPPTRAAVWNWQTNVAGGKSAVSSFGSGATSFWSSQVQQFLTWRSAHPEAPPPPDTTEGYTTFSYTTDGTKKPYSDAIWIKQYNGAPNGNYLVWQNSPPYEDTPFWQFHQTNNSGLNYVNVVCSQIP